MFTSFDKALVAMVMALLYFANYFHVFTLGLSPDVVSNILAALTPVLVYLFPNKAA